MMQEASLSLYFLPKCRLQQSIGMLGPMALARQAVGVIPRWVT
jgi:hypothetical protein